MANFIFRHNLGVKDIEISRVIAKMPNLVTLFPEKNWWTVNFAVCIIMGCANESSHLPSDFFWWKHGDSGHQKQDCEKKQFILVNISLLDILFFCVVLHNVDLTVPRSFLECHEYVGRKKSMNNFRENVWPFLLCSVRQIYS